MCTTNRSSSFYHSWGLHHPAWWVNQFGSLSILVLSQKCSNPSAGFQHNQGFGFPWLFSRYQTWRCLDSWSCWCFWFWFSVGISVDGLNGSNSLSSTINWVGFLVGQHLELLVVAQLVLLALPGLSLGLELESLILPCWCWAELQLTLVVLAQPELLVVLVWFSRCCGVLVLYQQIFHPIPLTILVVVIIAIVNT